jgi:hypothetical protein
MILKGESNFDDRLNKFIEEFTPDREYIIYGAGNNLQCLLTSMGDLLKVKYIVDDDKSLQNTFIDGVIIKSPEELGGEDHANAKIIITPYCGMHSEIIAQLKKMGYNESNFCHSYDITTLWNYLYKDKVSLPEIALLITTACPLKCKGCIVYRPYYHDYKQFPLKSIISDIDCMFSHMDFVYHICLAGGEPLLHSDLAEIIQYLQENYKNRYSKIRMNTSATVLPKPKVLQMMNEAGCYISISDYGDNCRKFQKIDQLTKLLEQNDIEYRVQAQFGFSRDICGLWSNFGSPLIPRNRTDEENRTLFKNCTDNCKWIHNQMLFSCPNITGAVGGGIYSPEKSDYIDLSKSSDKLAIVKMFLGYNERGYLSFCDRCDGYGAAVNNNYISAGEQVKK